MKRTLHLMFWSCLLTSLLAAKVISVSTADDIKRASKTVMPGDTVMMMNGAWRDQKVVFSAAGTANAPVVLRAETSGNVVLCGTSNLRFSGEYIIVQGLSFRNGGLESKGTATIEFRTSSKAAAEHSRLTDCAIVGYNPSDKWLDYKWVSVYGRENRIDHCTFSGKNHQGTLLVVWLDSLPGNHRIDHNYFGPRPVHGENGAETIRIGTSEWSMFSSKTIVEQNYFYSCDGEVEIISNKSNDNIYRYNTFVECAGTLTLRHANRAQVYGNYFFGHHKKNTGGVRVIGEDHLVYNNYFEGLEGYNKYASLTFMLGTPASKLNGYFQVKRARILFNTFVDNAVNMVLGATGSDPASNLPPEDCVIANNLILRSRGGALQEVVPPVRMTYAGNIVDGFAPPGTMSAQFRSAAVPMLQGTDKVWHPASGAPVIDAAAGNFPEVSEDIAGMPRTGKKDVGAEERTTATPLRRPLLRTDVGTTWNSDSTEP